VVTMLSDGDVFAGVRERDRCCVRCAAGGAGVRLAIHHRQGQDRSNNSAPNLILLCEYGPDEPCHQWCHGHARLARAGGWIVSRYVAPALIAAQPVLYRQPGLGRDGWYLLGEDLTLDGGQR